MDSNISDPGSTLMTAPREFDIVPATQTVAPQSQIEIKVIFLSICESLMHQAIQRSFTGFVLQIMTGNTRPTLAFSTEESLCKIFYTPVLFPSKLYID